LILARSDGGALTEMRFRSRTPRPPPPPEESDEEVFAGADATAGDEDGGAWRGGVAGEDPSLSLPVLLAILTVAARAALAVMRSSSCWELGGGRVETTTGKPRCPLKPWAMAPLDEDRRRLTTPRLCASPTPSAKLALPARASTLATCIRRPRRKKP